MQIDCDFEHAYFDSIAIFSFSPKDSPKLWLIVCYLDALETICSTWRKSSTNTKTFPPNGYEV